MWVLKYYIGTYILFLYMSQYLHTFFNVCSNAKLTWALLKFSEINVKTMAHMNKHAL